jgi:hypothetical protein
MIAVFLLLGFVCSSGHAEASLIGRSRPIAVGQAGAHLQMITAQPGVPADDPLLSYWAMRKQA